MSPRRVYAYVGPREIRDRHGAAAQGEDLLAWCAKHCPTLVQGDLLPATYIIDLSGRMLVADRHSEHVTCAGGQEVLSAGEIFLARDRSGRIYVAEISNQSTGYCPEPESWSAVAAALDALHIAHPGRFTTACTFRLCAACNQRNLVKDGHFFCEVCDAALPREWNFG